MLSGLEVAIACVGILGWAEEDVFEAQVAAAPPSERQGMRARRDAQRLEARRRRDHAELLEAINRRKYWEYD